MLKMMIVLIFCIVSNSVKSKSEMTAESACSPRVPNMSHDNAIKLAIEKASSVIPTNASFIDQVTLVCVENKYIWTVGFRRKAYESGHLVVNISMDGTTKVSVIKDG